MTLHLVDPEIDRLAQAVANATGEDVVEAVRKALAERLARVAVRADDPPNLAAQLMEIGRHYASLPIVDARMPDEIVGYDENGMW